MGYPARKRHSGATKKSLGSQRKICYVTDNPENPHPKPWLEEAALAVIDQFDPRAGAIT